jgi:oligopeptide transport system ATP-binding protein
MRQRVMIAIALACGPQLLIADEPTTALDVTIQAQILQLMKEIQRDTELGVILVTHDLGIVANTCDRVVVMYAGKVVEHAPVDELFNHPRHPYTQALLAAIPRLGQDRSRPLTTIEGRPPNLLQPPKGCPFAARCSHTMAICQRSMPSLHNIKSAIKHKHINPSDHQSACWLEHSLAAEKKQNKDRQGANHV